MKGGNALKKEEWYTFASAGKKVGRSEHYFGSIYRNHPEYFKDDFYKKNGRIWLISDTGIDEVLNQVKKEADHVIVRAST